MVTEKDLDQLIVLHHRAWGDTWKYRPGGGLQMEDRKHGVTKFISMDAEEAQFVALAHELTPYLVSDIRELRKENQSIRHEKEEKDMGIKDTAEMLRRLRPKEERVTEPEERRDLVGIMTRYKEALRLSKSSEEAVRVFLADDVPILFNRIAEMGNTNQEAEYWREQCNRLERVVDNVLEINRLEDEINDILEGMKGDDD